MNYIESQLQPEERILLRANQGRKWYHFLMIFILFCLLMPLAFWLIYYFLAPILGTIIPTEYAILTVLGFLGLMSISLLFIFIHFLLDEVALTNMRVLGRVRGATEFGFKKVEIPLSAIRSVRSGSFLDSSVIIFRNDGKEDMLIRKITPRKEFVAKLTELINRPV